MDIFYYKEEKKNNQLVFRVFSNSACMSLVLHFIKIKVWVAFSNKYLSYLFAFTNLNLGHRNNIFWNFFGLETRPPRDAQTIREMAKNQILDTFSLYKHNPVPGSAKRADLLNF